MQIDSLAFRGASFCVAPGRAHFDNVDFEFPLNEVVLVEGEAGAGKSLLLKAMAGLILPDSGQYLINGTNVSALSFAEFVPYRLNIGYSFEHGGLIGNKSVFENLMLPLQYHQVLDDRGANDKVESLIESFGLRDVQNCHPAELPGSFKRLAVVARSLVLEPELLLLDHPTTGLSNADRLHLADLIKQEKYQGHIKHVFIVSRQEAFIDNVTTRRIKIHDGLLEHC